MTVQVADGRGDLRRHPEDTERGGGAAVAAKSGLLKFLGRFSWIGLAAIGVAAAKLFKRKA